MNDLFAKRLEKAIYNLYCSGEQAPMEPVFNALHEGFANEMQVIVPIETPEYMLQLIGDPETVNVGDTFVNEEPIPLKYRRLAGNEEGDYYIPVFTSNEELKKGEMSSSINQALKDILDNVNNWEKCLGVVVNPWDKQLLLSKDNLSIVNQHCPSSHIGIVKGSVVDMHVDAIVNAANTSLLGGGGVDGAIHRAAGPELLKECRRLNGCKTGKAKITKAYNIKHADYIIHTVGPVYHGKERDADLLSDCYYNAMELAFQNGCRSIAFPGISTGVYGYPVDEAAKISLITVMRWLSEHEDAVMNVYFCCFKEKERKAYEALTKNI